MDPISEPISDPPFFEISEVEETSENESKMFSGVIGYGAHDGVRKNDPRLHLKPQRPSRHPLVTQDDVIEKNQYHHRILRCLLSTRTSF